MRVLNSWIRELSKEFITFIICDVSMEIKDDISMASKIRGLFKSENPRKLVPHE
jgi:hypothetical protein